MGAEIYSAAARRNEGRNYAEAPGSPGGGGDLAKYLLPVEYSVRFWGLCAAERIHVAYYLTF